MDWYQWVIIIFMLVMFFTGCTYVLEPQNIAKAVRKLYRNIRGIEEEIEPQPAQPKKKQQTKEEAPKAAIESKAEEV